MNRVLRDCGWDLGVVSLSLRKILDRVARGRNKIGAVSAISFKLGNLFSFFNLEGVKLCSLDFVY